MILAVLNPHVTSVLTGHGFVKHGHRNPSYQRAGDERVEIVEIQGNAHNRKAEGSLTANVAVFFPTLDPLVSTHPVRGRPEEVNCPIRFRIGQIDTDGRAGAWTDLPPWWEFGPTVEPAAVGTLVARAIQARALAFFDRIASRDALLEAVRTGQIRVSSLWTVAIAAWAGDPAHAEHLLRQELATSAPGRAFGQWRRRAAIVAEALELDFPRPGALPERRLGVTLLCPADADRDQRDQAYRTFYSGLMRRLPDDGPDYLFHIAADADGRTDAELYGPDLTALTELIRPVLDEVAAQPAGSGHPQWTLT